MDGIECGINNAGGNWKSRTGKMLQLYIQVAGTKTHLAGKWRKWLATFNLPTSLVIQENTRMNWSVTDHYVKNKVTFAVEFTDSGKSFEVREYVNT
jgi:hypothetical protein